ncbi:MAG: hypothetical protein IJ091_11340 [Oscillospiraceae bacterium]|nr:hypothetical protein [Oscillospiraceae bacterium]MBQ8996393.1 hypothetical protein [Oscillospiraceae bacterium]
MPRRFQLTNKNAAVYDLNTPGHYFYEPEGLGWGEEASLLRLGQTYLVTEEFVQQPVVSGFILFHSYQEYDNFLKFIQVGGLVLGYMPISSWRYINCTIQLGKTEIDHETLRLRCEVVFSGTSQWYERVSVQPSAGTIPDGAKLYNYRYPYKYAQGAAGTISVSNGSLSSYFRLKIAGLAENPVWRLYVAGVIQATGEVDATIPLGHSLIVNTRPSSMEIAEYDQNGEFYRDLYGFSNFATERLFSLPPGESTMAVADDNGTPTATLEVFRRV